MECRKYFCKRVERAFANVSHVAKKLGLGRNSFNATIEKLGLTWLFLSDSAAVAKTAAAPIERIKRESLAESQKMCGVAGGR